MRNYFIAFFSILLLSLSGCGTANKITDTWKAPEANLKNYNKVFIAALTGDVSVREKVEQELGVLFKDHDVEPVKSLSIPPPDITNKEVDLNSSLLQIVQETGSDAILTIAVIDQTSEERFVPGSGIYHPVTRFGYYSTFGGYYGNRYGQLYQPGYYTTDNTYYLETNIYDASSGNLVWSTQSETLNPSDLDSFLEGYLSSMSMVWQQEGLL